MTDRPAIKPLVWEPHPVFGGDDLAIAHLGLFGEHSYKYQAGRSADSPGYKVFLAPVFGSWIWVSDEYQTLEAAEAAAQADFAYRIRSCLLDKPEAGEGEAVGYVSQYTLDEVRGGRFGNIYPKSTLVPENEIPVYRAGTDGADAERLRKALTEVGEWINNLPIPTTGATRMLGIVSAALTKEPTHE